MKLSGPMKQQKVNPATKRKRVRELFARLKAKHDKKQILTSSEKSTHKP